MNDDQNTFLEWLFYLSRNQAWITCVVDCERGGGMIAKD